ncbi:PAS-domain containing protein [Porphyrobacter sp. YT40]|uniref:sensor histidine kinase n=1 Tax=Porphyrobacter sp. YT40 TaxID=2547601 RepID=UPI0011437BD0|nr:PAS-domain containing protein [Porphyrobacter sp. YT40]QDH35677.1 response regulator [Porphyrobacter sp. YT40]
MMLGAALVAAMIYLGALFWLAAWRDARPESGSGWLRRHASAIYGLSLAVYCTSWTFFGGVGTAATAGMDYLPIYLGPILVFTLGFGLVRRILAQAKAQHSTSIADFLSARYGKSASIAALVTVIASLGTLPYMALQLDAVGTTLLLMAPDLRAQLATDELVLIVAALMGLFAILFGSRRADRAGENAGLVLSIATEALVKLAALLAVGALAVWLLLTGEGPAPATPPALFAPDPIDARFIVLTALSAAAILCLPRQFHMSFIEAPGERADGAMRWVFPAYLALTAAVIVPLVLAARAALPAGTDPDAIVLALPLATGNTALAVLVFLGGLSAATGMIVVASVALSIMITNDLVAPLLLRRALAGRGDRSRLPARLLLIRRVTIAALLASAYAVYRGFAGITDLAGLGTLAFAAAAQFAPGLVLGMVSQHGNRAGMLAGLASGFALWLALLIWPALQGTAPPLAIHPDPLVSGVILSLGVNTALYWLVSAIIRPSLLDSAQAAAFVGTPMPGELPRRATAKRVGDVRALLGQFVGRERADAALAPLHLRNGDPAGAAVLELAERMISGVIGTSSARMLVHSWAGGDPIPLPEVVAMFGETGRRLNFSADLLQTAIESIDQGVALVDGEMRLVAWNSRYQQIFDLPDRLVQVGTPIADLIRFNLERGQLPEAEIAEQVERRLGYMRAGTEHRIERVQHDGRVLRIVGAPTPGGGYTTSYTDITADRRAEQALEEKVAERTHQLSEANALLAEATRSKTRFLAAASHDLIQPLNAARLFASALGEEVAGRAPLEKLVADLDGSIVAADRLIRVLLEISKLDSGGVVPAPEPIALDQLFEDVAREFVLQAQAKGLRLRRARTTAWVMADRALLTAVLRNLMSNAVRYTARGGILIGVRRRGDAAVICIHDTGRGIEPQDIERIFGEFERGASTDREGLGLGLAIVRRSARLLGVEIETTSQPGRGSRFALALPVLRRAAAPATVPAPARAASRLDAARVLVLDNDPAVLAATAALLGKWGLTVTCAASLAEARVAMPDAPDIAIMDYRLDGDERGDASFAALCEHWETRPPVILLTAESSEETEAAATRMGAHRLIKPAPPAALRALIATALAQGRDRADQPLAESATG